MISFLSHNEIDKARWDNCIQCSGQALVYAMSWYLDIVSPGWNALVEDDYSSVFPLTHRKKWGFNYLYQPPFTQQLGLFSKKIIEEADVLKFLQAIPSRYKLIEIQINAGNIATKFPREFQVRKRINHHLDLANPQEELQKHFSENTKRNIKRFQGSGNKIVNRVSPVDVVSLFRKNKGKEIERLVEKNYEAFLNLCKSAHEKNILQSRAAIDSSDEILAAVLFFKTHGGYILLFSALSPGGKACGAMSALISDFIAEHAGEKITLDFEGSMDPGIARFYKSFGSSEIVYLQIINNRLPLFLRWLKN